MWENKTLIAHNATRRFDHTQVVWNSVLSIEGAKYACLDVGNFYLETPMERYEYMKMPLSLFTEWIKQQYNLEENLLNGFVYWEMRKAVYGLPQVGMLANRQLSKHLKPAGFYEVNHTPGLWRHIHRPIQFSLIVDDFGVKYVFPKACCVIHLVKSCWFEMFAQLLIC